MRLTKTIREHKDGILAHTQDRLTNGFVEGINYRLLSLARNIGLHSVSTRVMLRCTT